MQISIILSNNEVVLFALLKDSIIVGCFGSLRIFIELLNLLLSFPLAFIPKIDNLKFNTFNFSFNLTNKHLFFYNILLID